MLKKILFSLLVFLSSFSVNAFPLERAVIQTRTGQQHIFDVEVARTIQEQTTGLMGRTTLHPNQGMLFIYNFPQLVVMWMKNCFVSLDMMFIDQSGIIQHIQKNTVPNSTDQISNFKPTKALLEINAGLTTAYNIQVGDRLIAPFLN